MSQDLFAMYAQKADTIAEGLYLPEPIPHETVFCDLKPGEFVPVSPMKSISTEEELSEALAALRKAYAPFLAELAPLAESKRQSLPLTEFLLDGEPVTLPDYGGPSCPCEKCYSTEFELPEFDGRAVEGKETLIMVVSISAGGICCSRSGERTERTCTATPEASRYLALLREEIRLSYDEWDERNTQL